MQEYWSVWPFPSRGYLLHPGTEPGLSEYRQILYHLSHRGSPSGQQEIGEFGGMLGQQLCFLTLDEDVALLLLSLI